MWGEGNTKDAEVQTEDPPLESTAHHSQDLIETANSGLTGQMSTKKEILIGAVTRMIMTMIMRMKLDLRE